MVDFREEKPLAETEPWGLRLRLKQIMYNSCSQATRGRPKKYDNE